MEKDHIKIGAPRVSLTKYFGNRFSRVSLTKHGRENMANCMQVLRMVSVELLLLLLVSETRREIVTFFATSTWQGFTKGVSVESRNRSRATLAKVFCQ